MHNQTPIDSSNFTISSISPSSRTSSSSRSNIQHAHHSNRPVSGTGSANSNPLLVPGRHLNLLFGGLVLTNRVPAFGIANISSTRGNATQEDFELVQHALFTPGEIDPHNTNVRTEYIDDSTLMSVSYRIWSPQAMWHQDSDLEVNIRTPLQGDLVSCEIIRHVNGVPSHTLHADFTPTIEHTFTTPPAPENMLPSSRPRRTAGAVETPWNRHTPPTIDCSQLEWLETDATTNPNMSVIPFEVRKDVANALRNAPTHPLHFTLTSNQGFCTEIMHGRGPAFTRIHCVELVAGQLNVTRIHYFPDGRNGIMSTQLRNPNFEHFRGGTTASTDSVIAQNASSAKRSRPASHDIQNHERNVRMRSEFTQVDASVLLLQQPEGEGGCPAAVINHLFQAKLVEPHERPTGTLDQTAQDVERMSQVKMNFHTVILPRTGNYRDFPADVQRQIDALEAGIKHSCKAAFEIGNVSDSQGGRTHQVTLIYMAGRNQPGQLTGNEPFVIVLDSFDAEMKQAMPWHFDTVRDALIFIADKTVQQDGRVISAICPEKPLPPPTTNLNNGGDIADHGHVEFENLSEKEKTTLKQRAETEFRPFQSAVSTTTTSVAEIDIGELDIVGMENYQDPVWNERIQGLNDLTFPESRKSLVEFWRAHPDLAPDDPHLTAAVGFLAYQQTLGRDASAFLRQPLDERSKQVATHINTTISSASADRGLKMTERKSAMRHTLATWLEWSAPRPELFEKRNKAIWCTRLGNNFRDVNSEHRDAVIRYYRLARLTGIAENTAKLYSTDLRNHLLGPLENDDLPHTNDFRTAWSSGDFDSKLDAYLSLIPAQREAELQVCAVNAASTSLLRVNESLKLLGKNFDTSPVPSRSENREMIHDCLSIFPNMQGMYRRTMNTVVIHWEGKYPGCIKAALLALDTTNRQFIRNYVNTFIRETEVRNQAVIPLKALFSWAHVTTYLNDAGDQNEHTRIVANLQRWSTSGLLTYEYNNQTCSQYDLLAFVRSHDDHAWQQHLGSLQTHLGSTLQPAEVQAVLDDVTAFRAWVLSNQTNTQDNASAQS